MTNGTPFVGFDNETLNRQPRIRKGDVVECPHCGGEHIAQAATNEDGSESELILFYSCGESTYIAAVAGRLVIGTPADVSGHL